jgi:hypothetical protein
MFEEHGTCRYSGRFGKLASIAICHRSHDNPMVLTIVEHDLGDLRKIAAGDENIVRRIGAKLMEINALEKMLLIGGTLRAWIACVIEALAIGRPCKTATAGWILNARYYLASIPAARYVEYMQ